MRVKKTRGGKGMFSVDDFIKSFYFEADFIKLYPLDSPEYLIFKEAIKTLLDQGIYGHYMDLLAQMPKIYGCESELDCIFSSLLLFFLRQTKKIVVYRIFGDFMVIPQTKLNFLHYTANYIAIIMRQYERLVNEKIASTYRENSEKKTHVQILK